MDTESEILQALKVYSLYFKSKFTRGVGGNQGYVGRSPQKCLGGLQKAFACHNSSSNSFGVNLLGFILLSLVNIDTLQFVFIILYFVLLVCGVAAGHTVGAL